MKETALLVALLFASYGGIAQPSNEIPIRERYMPKGRYGVYKSPANKPNFVLVPIVNRSTVSPHDTVEIGLLIYGDGPVDEASIHGYALPQLVEDSIEIVNWEFEQNALDKTMALMDFDRVYYPPGVFGANLQLAIFHRVDTTTSRVWAEQIILRNGHQYATYMLKFTIAENAPIGEHRIPLTLKFLHKGDSYVSTSAVILRVMSFGERYRPSLVAILSLLIALITWGQKWECFRPMFHRPIKVKYVYIPILVGCATAILFLLFRQ